MRILIIVQVMKILTVMMMKTCSVMTKWSLYDCGMGLGQGLYNESVHNGARLIYALASTQSTCTHTLYRLYFYTMYCAGRNQVFIFVPRLCIIHMYMIQIYQDGLVQSQGTVGRDLSSCRLFTDNSRSTRSEGWSNWVLSLDCSSKSL